MFESFVTRPSFCRGHSGLSNYARLSGCKTETNVRTNEKHKYGIVHKQQPVKHIGTT